MSGDFMGIEIVNINAENLTPAAGPSPTDLVSPQFQTVQVPHPAMSVWLMTLPVGENFFPWWGYQAKIDDELRALHQMWNISSPQGLFDCLFLAQMQKTLGANLYIIFSGNIKTQGWSALKEADQNTFQRGQGCVFHLLGSFNGKFNINWVPFWEPQSIVRNPGFGSLWRLFSNNGGDDITRCLTFFSVSNPRLLPEVTKHLIERDDQRSEKLSALTDWYGIYTSPLGPSNAACCAVYARNKELLTKFDALKTQFMNVFTQTQKDLFTDLEPRSALRILSRAVAI